MNAEEKLKHLTKLIDDNKAFFIETFHEPIRRDGYYFGSGVARDLFISCRYFDKKYVSQILFLKGATNVFAIKSEPFAKVYRDHFNEEISVIVSYGDTLLDSLNALEARINFILDIEKNRLFI